MGVVNRVFRGIPVFGRCVDRVIHTDHCAVASMIAVFGDVEGAGIVGDDRITGGRGKNAKTVPRCGIACAIGYPDLCARIPRNGWRVIGK